VQIIGHGGPAWRPARAAGPQRRHLVAREAFKDSRIGTDERWRRCRRRWSRGAHHAQAEEAFWRFLVPPRATKPPAFSAITSSNRQPDTAGAI
jgi:hypothetical protein